MEISLQKSLEKAWTVVSAAMWATIGGGVGVIADALDDLAVYEGPLDWVHLRKVFLAGAIMGFIGWVRKEKALATPIAPTPQSDAEAVKRVADAEQTADAAKAAATPDKIVVVEIAPPSTH